MTAPTLTSATPLLAAADRKATQLRALGVLFMIAGSATDGRFSVVEHPMRPRSLAAPYHTHTREDEFSLVLEGEVGFALDQKVIVGRPGDTVFKPRHIRHTFWNAGDSPARILEIISPAGFEEYFAEVGDAFAAASQPDAALLAGIAARYGLSLEPQTVPELMQKYGLR